MTQNKPLEAGSMDMDLVLTEEQIRGILLKREIGPNFIKGFGESQSFRYSPNGANLEILTKVYPVELTTGRKRMVVRGGVYVGCQASLIAQGIYDSFDPDKASLVHARTLYEQYKRAKAK